MAKLLSLSLSRKGSSKFLGILVLFTSLVSTSYAWKVVDQDGNVKLKLNSNGFFGIATSNPTRPLTISKNYDIDGANSGGAILIEEKTNSNKGIKLRIEANEMQASNDGKASPFNINPYGGRVNIGATTQFGVNNTDLYVYGNVVIGPKSEKNLDVSGNILSKKNLYNQGTDFHLGNKNDGRGDPGLARALVHGDGNKLIINYDGDYSGGTYIASDLEVKGNTSFKKSVSIDGNLSVNGQSIAPLEMYIKSKYVGEGTKVCCNNKDILIEGHWTTYLGKQSTFYKRDGLNCIKGYEGKGRDGKGTLEILCLKTAIHTNQTGTWSKWSSWSKCKNNIQKRTRTCSKKGTCVGSDIETRPCHHIGCDACPYGYEIYDRYPETNNPASWICKNVEGGSYVYNTDGNKKYPKKDRRDLPICQIRGDQWDYAILRENWTSQNIGSDDKVKTEWFYY